MVGACQPDAGPTTERVALQTRVDYVVDGDTIWIDDLGESVRLIGIDAPEIYPEQECFGEEARLGLMELIPAGTRVEIRFDTDEIDRFGRYLGYVYRVADDVFVNLAMVEAGYAETLRFEPNVRFADELREAEEGAAERGAGLWSAC